MNLRLVNENEIEKLGNCEVGKWEIYIQVMKKTQEDGILL
jgi:hypothetical protein